MAEAVEEVFEPVAEAAHGREGSPAAVAAVDGIGGRVGIAIAATYEGSGIEEYGIVGEQLALVDISESEGFGLTGVYLRRYYRGVESFLGLGGEDEGMGEVVLQELAHEGVVGFGIHPCCLDGNAIDSLYRREAVALGV